MGQLVHKRGKNHIALRSAIVVEPFGTSDSFIDVGLLKASIVKIEGCGDLAYVFGTVTITMAPPGAAPVQDVGKYVEIRRKQPNGKWLISVDIFNSDAPPATAPAPAKK